MAGDTTSRTRKIVFGKTKLYKYEDGIGRPAAADNALRRPVFGADGRQAIVRIPLLHGVGTASDGWW